MHGLSMAISTRVIGMIFCGALFLWIGDGSNAASLGTEPIPGVKFLLESSGEGMMKLKIQESTGVQKSVIVGLTKLEQDRFLDFPKDAAIQLRGSNGKLLERRNRGVGWFYPSILNSIVDQPVFSRNGDASAAKREEPKLDRIQLPAHGEVESEFCYRDAVALSRASFADGVPSEFRVRVEVSIEGEEGHSVVNVTSDWIQMPGVVDQ